MEIRITNSKRKTMKALYKSILIIVLAPLSLVSVAQKDSTLTRQVMLEREYTPSLQEASKINIQPSIYSPNIKQREVTFINTVPQIGLSNNRIGASASGDIKTSVMYDKKRGYFVFGAGNYANLDGALGYRVLETEKDELNIFANHSSMNGKLDYLQSGLAPANPKAKYADSKINLNYQHKFAPSVLSFETSFFNTAYNYYGNYFTNPLAFIDPSMPSPFDLESKQNVNVFSIGAGLRSGDDNQGVLKYVGKVNYSSFSNKYGVITTDKGVSGGQLDLNADFYTELDADKTIGVKGYLMNQSFSNADSPLLLPYGYHKLTDITGTPYFKMQGMNWDVSVGANVSVLFDVKNNFVITPDLKASIHIHELNTLYGSIGGGINNNTFLQILQENRYVNPISRIEYSKTLYDAQIGFKSGVLQGFEFDVYGGYKHTRKDHLFAVGSTSSWGNVSTPVYADVSTGHIGGLVKTTLIPYTDLSARATAYFYNVKYTDAYTPVVDNRILTEKHAWGLPNFTFDLNADVHPIEKVTVSLNYQFVGGRKALFLHGDALATPLRMKNINELNLRGEYKINDWAAVNLRLNNILFQEYEIIYGYPLQSFNALAGVSLRF